jgi:hypothetical protein
VKHPCSEIPPSGVGGIQSVLSPATRTVWTAAVTKARAVVIVTRRGRMVLGQSAEPRTQIIGCCMQPLWP